MGNILVTGARGFIGSHLVDELSKQSPIIAFDVIEGQRPLPANVLQVEGDLTSYQNLLGIGEETEGIVHLGAVSRVSDGVKSPLKCVAVNVMGTMNILELARNMKKPPWVVLGSTIETAENVYGLSKNMAELCAERYANDFLPKVMILKFTSTYGSVRDNGDKLIPKLISRALENMDIHLNNSKTSFDFIHIDDLVNGILSGIEYCSNQNGSLFQKIPLCTGQYTSLEKLASIIVKEANSHSKIIINRDEDEKLPDLDNRKAKEVLKFEANIKIEAGIQRTIKAFDDLRV